MFQRDFVWTTKQTARLLDSIIKGFPIGSFVFWKTRDQLQHIRNIGNIQLPATPKGDSVQYVLDGQQRITSLYAVRKGVRITKEGEEIDYSGISIDLSPEPDADEQIVTSELQPGLPYISVYELLNASLTELTSKFAANGQLQKIDVYRKRLTGYDFSVIVIDEYPIDIACEVFTRINTGGTALTIFEIMVAKTYDEGRGFDLAQEYERMIDSKGKEKDLTAAGFETIPDSVMLQCLGACLSKNTRGRDILKLDKDSVIKEWPAVRGSIFAAVDYVRTHLRIPVSRLLPYDSLLVPLTYFFYKAGQPKPSHDQDKLLVQYFWWASLSSRFTSGAEGKLNQDILRMDEILAGNPPSYAGEEVKLDKENLMSRWFRTGDAFCKAILCLYAYKEPKSFDSNGVVKLDNSWLKVASSKNYHHFFPRAYLTKSGFTDGEANVILNITLVDDFLNKRQIGAKPPGTYMKTFRKNADLADTMKSHLIDDLDDYGVWNDDYRTFLERRADKVIKDLERRLYPKLA
jgi:hypothetical protein